MANIKNLPADLQGLPSFPCNGSRYYYKEQDEKKLLVAQIFGKSHYVLRFPEGTTVDVIPADSVGTEEIKNGSVGMDDLNDLVKGFIEEAGRKADEAVQSTQTFTYEGKTYTVEQLLQALTMLMDSTIVVHE